tara:strand:+ start:115 stop:402 length:288 start_codon:yes stop_codon:yes gene_type:complete
MNTIVLIFILIIITILIIAGIAFLVAKLAIDKGREMGYLSDAAIAQYTNPQAQQARMASVLPYLSPEQQRQIKDAQKLQTANPIPQVNTTQTSQR